MMSINVAGLGVRNNGADREVVVLRADAFNKNIIRLVRN